MEMSKWKKNFRPPLGHCVAFPGGLWHGGEPITSGVRYIIAAFLWVAAEGEGEAQGEGPP